LRYQLTIIRQSGPIASIKAGNKNNTLDAHSAQVYLIQISAAIHTAKAQTLLAHTKRDLTTRQSDDLTEVGAVLAKVITDLVEAIEGIAKDLESLPLIVSLSVYYR
jgi:cellobiose-specific phosphotransferase system component IIA